MSMIFTGALSSVNNIVNSVTGGGNRKKSQELTPLLMPGDPNTHRDKVSTDESFYWIHPTVTHGYQLRSKCYLPSY